jgi:hypothetical protein
MIVRRFRKRHVCGLQSAEGECGGCRHEDGIRDSGEKLQQWLTERERKRGERGERK